MKNILLPTDFSDNSKRAIKYAIKLFGTEEVKYTLLNTYKIYNTRAGLSTSNLKKEMESIAEEELQLLKKELKSEFSSIIIKLRDEFGGMLDVLSSLSKRDFDLIVMGTKGASGIKEVFLGSNTWDVIEHVNIPIIAVPSDAEKLDIKNIVVAIDEKEYSSKEKFDKLIELAKQNNSTITFLRIDSPKTNSSIQQKQITDWFQNIEIKFAWMKSEDVEQGIHNFVDASECDLLVLVNRKKSFWEELFHSSLTKKLTFHSHVPLMALKD